MTHYKPAAAAIDMACNSLYMMPDAPSLPRPLRLEWDRTMPGVCRRGFRDMGLRPSHANTSLDLHNPSTILAAGCPEPALSSSQSLATDMGLQPPYEPFPPALTGR